MGIKEDIQKIVDYLTEEEKHFWENCECDEDNSDFLNIDLCKCNANKSHIYRNASKVDVWLNSASCPLVDEEEI